MLPINSSISSYGFYICKHSRLMDWCGKLAGEIDRIFIPSQAAQINAQAILNCSHIDDEPQSQCAADMRATLAQSFSYFQTFFPATWLHPSFHLLSSALFRISFLSTSFSPSFFALMYSSRNLPTHSRTRTRKRPSRDKHRACSTITARRWQQDSHMLREQWYRS